MPGKKSGKGRGKNSCEYNYSGGRRNGGKGKGRQQRAKGDADKQNPVTETAAQQQFEAKQQRIEVPDNTPVDFGDPELQTLYEEFDRSLDQPGLSEKDRDRLVADFQKKVDALINQRDQERASAVISIKPDGEPDDTGAGMLEHNTDEIQAAQQQAQEAIAKTAKTAATNVRTLANAPGQTPDNSSQTEPLPTPESEQQGAETQPDKTAAETSETDQEGMKIKFKRKVYSLHPGDKVIYMNEEYPVISVDDSGRTIEIEVKNPKGNGSSKIKLNADALLKSKKLEPSADLKPLKRKKLPRQEKAAKATATTETAPASTPIETPADAVTGTAENTATDAARSNENQPAETKDNEKKQISLKEWQNNRKAFIIQLMETSGYNQGMESLSAAERAKILSQNDAKIDEWERINPRPETPAPEGLPISLETAADEPPPFNPPTGETAPPSETPPPFNPPTGETPPPPHPFETPAANAEKNTVIRDIANQGILRKKLRAEALARGENPTDEQINELAKRQAEFVKAARVEEMILRGNDRIKTIFKPEGNPLDAEGLKQELLKTLLDKSSIENQKKLKHLSRQLSNQTGMSMEEVEQLIDGQEQRLRDEALAEVNAGRFAGSANENAAQNMKSRNKKKLGWTLAKSAAYIGGGALLTGVTGGYGAIAALTGVRIIDRIITDRLQKKQVDAKFAEMKSRLEATPAERDAFLKEFFAESAVAQQKRISGDRDFDFEGFNVSNPDLLAGYSEEEQGEVMRALGALQEIDKINYVRENDLLERLANRLKKSDNPVLKFLDQAAMGFNKFMVKGGENTYERAVSAAMLGGAAIAAREMPFIRNLMLAMSGWKAGDVLGRKIWGAEKPELGKVEDIDSAQDILDMLEVMESRRDSEKQKRLLMKAGTSLLFAAMPAIAGSVMEHFQHQGTAHVEMDHNQANEEEFRRAMERPMMSAGGAEAVKAAVEAPHISPLEAATKAMESVHGDKSPHLWGLIGEKMNKMTEGLREVPSVRELAESDGRMTFMIDSVKDKLAAHPQDFGLAAGTNVDVLSHADLEKISQNPHFNELIAGMFKEGSFAEQAQNLSEAAAKNIEANNAYYHEVASHLKPGVRLDQGAYDAMDRLHAQGMSADAAAQAMQNATETAAPAAAHVESAVQAATAETANVAPVENFQDALTKEKWNGIFENMKANDKNLVSKSLDSIFRRTGIADNYNGFGMPYFRIENASTDNGIVSFEIPTPGSGAELMGNMKFSYDPAKKELLGYVNDISANAEKVSNIDDALKTVFKKLSDQLSNQLSGR